MSKILMVLVMLLGVAAARGETPTVRSGAAQQQSKAVLKASPAMEKILRDTRTEIENLQRQITPQNFEEIQRQIREVKRKGEIVRLQLLVKELEAAGRLEEAAKAARELDRRQHPVSGKPAVKSNRIPPPEKVVRPVNKARKTAVVSVPHSSLEGGAR